MNKKKILIGAGCGAVAVIAIVLVIIFVINKKDGYRDITVFDTKGTVNVERTQKIIEAVKDMKLKSGDKVTVGDESFTRLCADDDKYLYVKEGTKLKLDATGTSANSKTAIYLSEGEIIVEVQKKLNEESSFDVVTPNTTMSIRGTIIAISVRNTVDENGNLISETENVVLEGKALIGMFTEDGSVSGIANAGEGVTFKSKSKFDLESFGNEIPEIAVSEQAIAEAAKLVEKIGGEAFTYVDVDKLIEFLDEIKVYINDAGSSDNEGLSDRFKETAKNIETIISAANKTRDTEPAPSPTAEPTNEPTADPTPTPEPTVTPTPTNEPTVSPTPTEAPTVEPTAAPTVTPTPTAAPTRPADPTATPTAIPTQAPPATPTATPTVVPTATATPTEAPTVTPSATPTVTVTPIPTVTPVPTPTPSPTPTDPPTPVPTPETTPTPEPTNDPTNPPTQEPTPELTYGPTISPTQEPTPTAEPTQEPTPTGEPTQEPTPTAEPTQEPTPTAEPTQEPTPTAEPTQEPTPEPTPVEITATLVYDKDHNEAVYSVLSGVVLELNTQDSNNTITATFKFKDDNAITLPTSDKTADFTWTYNGSTITSISKSAFGEDTAPVVTMSNIKLKHILTLDYQDSKYETLIAALENSTGVINFTQDTTSFNAIIELSDGAGLTLPTQFSDANGTYTETLQWSDQSQNVYSSVTSSSFGEAGSLVLSLNVANTVYSSYTLNLTFDAKYEYTVSSHFDGVSNVTGYEYNDGTAVITFNGEGSLSLPDAMMEPYEEDLAWSDSASKSYTSLTASDFVNGTLTLSCQGTFSSGLIQVCVNVHNLITEALPENDSTPWEFGSVSSDTATGYSSFIIETTVTSENASVALPALKLSSDDEVFSFGGYSSSETAQETIAGISWNEYLQFTQDEDNAGKLYTVFANSSISAGYIKVAVTAAGQYTDSLMPVEPVTADPDDPKWTVDSVNSSTSELSAVTTTTIVLKILANVSEGYVLPEYLYQPNEIGADKIIKIPSASSTQSYSYSSYLSAEKPNGYIVTGIQYDSQNDIVRVGEYSGSGEISSTFADNNVTEWHYVLSDQASINGSNPSTEMIDISLANDGSVSSVKKSSNSGSLLRDLFKKPYSSVENVYEYASTYDYSIFDSSLDEIESYDSGEPDGFFSNNIYVMKPNYIDVSGTNVSITKESGNYIISGPENGMSAYKMSLRGVRDEGFNDVLALIIWEYNDYNLEITINNESYCEGSYTINGESHTLSQGVNGINEMQDSDTYQIIISNVNEMIICLEHIEE